MFAPKGTPSDVIETVSAHVAEIVNSDGYSEEMQTKGLLPAYLPSDGAVARLRELEATVRPIIEAIK